MHALPEDFPIGKSSFFRRWPWDPLLGTVLDYCTFLLLVATYGVGIGHWLEERPVDPLMMRSENLTALEILLHIFVFALWRTKGTNT